MIRTPSGENWQIRLYLNGQEIGSGTSKNLPVSSVLPDSLVLGTVVYYLHGAYYRGLMSDMRVIGRILSTEEIRSTLTLSPP